jgi:hypothetical protein
MTRRCRYETPMFLDGTPDGLRARRKVIGKRTGFFELREKESGFILPVGTVSRPTMSPPDVEYFSAADGSGLFRSEGVLDGRSFEADSRLSVMNDWREALVTAVIQTGKTDMRQWYPLDNASLIERKPVEGARALYEIKPEQYSDIDIERFDALHEKHGQELAANYVACGRSVFTPEQMPFIAVQMKRKVEVVTMCRVEIESFADGVRVFGILDHDAAVRYAKDLAAAHGMDVSIGDCTIDIQRPEFFDLDVEATRFRLTGNSLLAAFVASVSRMNPINVAMQVSIVELELARNLQGVLNGPEWRRNLDVIEAAINDCIDYEERSGAGRFVPRDTPSARVLMDEWRDRAVDLRIVGPTHVSRPGFL